MAGAANLADPAIIRTFRGCVARYRQRAATALAGAPSALAKVVDQLRFELGPHWKRELARRQDAHAEARRKWLAAEAEVRARGQRGQVERASAEDERRDMLRLERRCHEAEEKLTAVRTWLARLDGDGKDLLAKCQGHANTIEDVAEAATRHLDRLAADIDTYLQRGPA